MTDVDICNMALARLGQGPIADFNAGTTEALLLKAQYPILRDTVLTARAWTFATKRVQLSSAVPPDPIPSGWGYAYLVPGNPDVCLRVVQLYVPNPAGAVVVYVEQQFDGLYTQISWERLVDYLYANVGPTVWCKYIFQVTDTSKFDPAFVDALSAKIAMEMAMPITNSPAILDGMHKLYQLKLQEASSTEGQQGTTQKIQGRTLAARRL